MMMMMIEESVEAIEATGLILENNVIGGCVSTHLPEQDSCHAFW